MNKQNLSYVVRNKRMTIDDGYGYQIACSEQIEFYDIDHAPIDIAKFHLYKGLGGSIHYLNHLVMHPCMIEKCKYSYWKYIPIEEDENAEINERVYKGKISGAFYDSTYDPNPNHYSTRESNYHPIVVILSEDVPENIIYIVHSNWDETTSLESWERQGITYEEYTNNFVYKEYKHPYPKTNIEANNVLEIIERYEQKFPTQLVIKNEL